MKTKNSKGDFNLANLRSDDNVKEKLVKLKKEVKKSISEISHDILAGALKELHKELNLLNNQRRNLEGEIGEARKALETKKTERKEWQRKIAMYKDLEKKLDSYIKEKELRNTQVGRKLEEVKKTIAELSKK